MDVKDLRSWDSVKREFKFTDLLAIIAVLLLLAVLIVPPDMRPKGGSNKSKCFANMKQIGFTFAMYCVDNDGLYPPGGHGGANIAGRPPEPAEKEEDGLPEQDWTTLTQPYVKNFAKLRCPSDTSLRPKDPASPDHSHEYLSSYTVNAWTEYRLAESAVSNLPNWVLLTERNNVAQSPRSGWSFYWWLWQDNVWPPALSPDPTPKASEDLDLNRHSNTSNWLFGDGHVKYGRFPELWKAGSENAFWPHGK